MHPYPGENKKIKSNRATTVDQTGQDPWGCELGEASGPVLWSSGTALYRDVPRIGCPWGAMALHSRAEVAVVDKVSHRQLVICPTRSFRRSHHLHLQASRSPFRRFPVGLHANLGTSLVFGGHPVPFNVVGTMPSTTCL